MNPNSPEVSIHEVSANRVQVLESPILVSDSGSSDPDVSAQASTSTQEEYPITSGTQDRINSESQTKNGVNVDIQNQNRIKDHTVRRIIYSL